jgi:hypothetical protein
MRPWIALLLCVAASCGGDDELRLVPCASSQNAFDIEEVSTLEDAYALRGGADGIALDDDPGRHPPGSTWRVSQVSVLVMIPESAFAEYPQGDRLTVQVWDGADPRRGEPYAVTQVLAPEALQWAAVTLSDPQLAEETAFRKAWWTFDFTGVIPEAGLSASRYFVGVRQRPRAALPARRAAHRCRRRGAGRAARPAHHALSRTPRSPAARAHSHRR